MRDEYIRERAPLYFGVRSPRRDWCTRHLFPLGIVKAGRGMINEADPLLVPSHASYPVPRGKLDHQVDGGDYG